jgi:acetyl esterase/lipase
MTGGRFLGYRRHMESGAGMGMKVALLGVGLLVAATLTAGACAPLRTFDTLMPKDAASVETARGLAYGAGPRRMLDIYAPRGTQAGAKTPVIVFIYGGSWANGSREGYGFAGRALAAAGFVTVIADYRLVPEVHFPGFVEDCAAAVKWTRGHIADYGGDPERIVLVGHSAGAYNAAMLALDPQWLGPDRAAIRGFAGLAGPYDFLPFDGPIPVRTFSNWPKPDETQPIYYADASAPPTLLLHGGEDDTVWPKNSINLAAKLKKAGTESELKVYPELGHVGIVTALAKPFRGRAPVLADVAAFAHRVTDGRR